MRGWVVAALGWAGCVGSAPAQGLSPVVDSSGLPYELFLPNEASSPAPHPVLVFLHGRGESGAFDVTNAQSLPLQLLQNESFAATFPFIVVVPQCPSSCAMHNGWAPRVLQTVTKIVTDTVVPKYQGDPHRVYLAGQSMGGHGSWMYGAQQQGFFAAVVVVCGYSRSAEERATIAERLTARPTPTAVFHSADDIVIPVFASDEMVQALKDRGHTDVRYTRYAHAPGPPMPEFADLQGHGSYELAFRDATLYAWLLARRCDSCGSASAAWVPLGR